MKQIIKFAFMAFAVALVSMTACSPQEFDDYSLGSSSYTMTQDQFTFDVTPGSNAWIYNYTSTFSVDPVKYPYTYEIRFGDGGVTKDMKGSHEYVVAKGTYTAQCIVYTPNGDVLVKEKAIVIAEDNEKIFTDDPASPQFALTGGKDNVNGKTWFLGPWTAMRNPDNRGEVWWDFGGPDPAMMNDQMTFIPNSVKTNGRFIYDNNGDTFMNESLGNLFPDGDPSGSFVTVNYTPPTGATWEIIERGGKKFLSITKGFISYPTSPDDLEKTEYEILSFSPSSIRLVLSSGWDGWCYELVSEAPSSPLTGDGEKTWVIDANNKHLQEVKDALPDLAGRLKGHMGLGPINSYAQEWWGAGAGEKSYDNTLASVGHGWTYYDWKMTFTSAGGLKIVTAGEGYGRNALKDAFPYVWNNNDDMAFPYTGGDYTYTKANATPYPILTLSGDAFFGYYVGTQEYEIIYVSDTALAVAAHNTAEGQDWVFILCPDGEQ